MEGTGITTLRRRVRSRLVIWLRAPVVVLFGVLPWSAAQRFGAGLGRLAYWIARRDRRRSLEHLAIAFPELSETQRSALSKAGFRHLGMAVGELLHIRHRPPAEASRHVQVEGFEEIERLRQQERPILILTGHCGNWELISTANHSHGLGLAAIARQFEDADLHASTVDFRAHLGSETIARSSPTASRQLLGVLRARGALAILIDQDIDAEGAFVPFFGRLAHTSLGAAQLAIRLGAAVVPTFSERLSDGSHLVRFLPALELPDDSVEATARMTMCIEDQIRRHPEQWVWMHRRWRRRPPEGD
jgi:KDO2-lipid IV(A) lauroyltransferase